MLPLRLRKLALWYLVTYLVVIRLQFVLRDGGMAHLIESFNSPHRIGLFLTSNLSFGAYTFGAYLLLRYLHQRARGLVIAAAFVCLLVGIMSLRALLEEGLLYSLFGLNNYNPAMTWLAYFRDNLYYAIVFIPVGVVYFFVQHGRYTEVLHLRTEAHLRKVELKFLRSQVNPHFLFNTLNNLYALVSTNNPQSLIALEKLSSLLRYSLYTQEDLIPLDRELAYVHDLIHLESLRIHGLAPPTLSVSGATADWEIPPLILVPFVENAFKHGALTCPDQPLRIRLDAGPSRLAFSVTNSLRPTEHQTDGVGGIGLSNVRKRLDILYPGAHELVVHRAVTTFSVRLTIDRTPTV